MSWLQRGRPEAALLLGLHGFEEWQGISQLSLSEEDGSHTCWMTAPDGDPAVVVRMEYDSQCESRAIFHHLSIIDLFVHPAIHLTLSNDSLCVQMNLNVDNLRLGLCKLGWG